MDVVYLFNGPAKREAGSGNNGDETPVMQDEPGIPILPDESVNPSRYRANTAYC
jgi:hypothetical protein